MLQGRLIPHFSIFAVKPKEKLDVLCSTVESGALSQWLPLDVAHTRVPQ